MYLMSYFLRINATLLPYGCIFNYTYGCKNIYFSLGLKIFENFLPFEPKIALKLFLNAKGAALPENRRNILKFLRMSYSFMKQNKGETMDVPTFRTLQQHEKVATLL